MSNTKITKEMIEEIKTLSANYKTAKNFIKYVKPEQVGIDPEDKGFFETLVMVCYYEDFVESKVRAAMRFETAPKGVVVTFGKDDDEVAENVCSEETIEPETTEPPVKRFTKAVIDDLIKSITKEINNTDIVSETIMEIAKALGIKNIDKSAKLIQKIVKGNLGQIKKLNTDTFSKLPTFDIGNIPVTAIGIMVKLGFNVKLSDVETIANELFSAYEHIDANDADITTAKPVIDSLIKKHVDKDIVFDDSVYGMIRDYFNGNLVDHDVAESEGRITANTSMFNTIEQQDTDNMSDFELPKCFEGMVSAGIIAVALRARHSA